MDDTETDPGIDDQIQDEVVDSVHPRINAMLKYHEKMSSSKSRQKSQFDDEGCPILVDFSSSESSSSNNILVPEYVPSVCSICGNAGHITKERIRSWSSVKVIERLNCNGTITSEFIFPSTSPCRSYLPNINAMVQDEGSYVTPSKESDEGEKKGGIKFLTCCWKL